MVGAREEYFKNGVIKHADAAKRLAERGQKLVPLDLAARGQWRPRQEKCQWHAVGRSVAGAR